MNKNIAVRFTACAAVVAIVFSSHAMTVHRLFSTHPAEDSLAGWERESYPIGNGWFGTCRFGAYGFIVQEF